MRSSTSHEPGTLLELHVGSLSQGLGCDPSPTILNCVCVLGGVLDPRGSDVRGAGCGLKRRMGQTEPRAWGQPGL